MATAIYTHKYKEAIQVTRTWIKTGDIRILWGLIVIPQGYYYTTKNHLLLCQRCGQPEFTPEHGHHKIDKLK